MSSSECQQLQLLLTGGPPWGFRLRGGGGGAGLWVRRVRRRSPAHAAGLNEGDRLVSLNGASLIGRSHAFAAQLIERGKRGSLSLCVERWISPPSVYGRLDWTAASSSLGDLDNTDTWQDDFSELAAAAAANESDWFNNEAEDEFGGSLTPVQELPVPELPLRKLLAEAPGPSTNGFTNPYADLPAIPFNRLVREPTPSLAPVPSTGTRRRYADSAYAGTPGYPTVEERKRMARRVARSLTDPINRASRGAGMFAGRRQRADKFTVEGPEPNSFDVSLSKPINAMIDTSTGTTDSRIVPLSSDVFVRPTQPKTVAEFVEQELQSAPKLTHADYNPAKAFELAAALRQGKAAQVLEKRRQRAEKFVVEGFGQGGGVAAAVANAPAMVGSNGGAGDGGGVSEL